MAVKREQVKWKGRISLTYSANSPQQPVCDELSTLTMEKQSARGIHVGLKVSAIAYRGAGGAHSANPDYSSVGALVSEDYSLGRARRA